MNIKKAFASAVLAAMAIGPLYLLVRGLLTMQTLALRGGSGGATVVSAATHLVYFWTTLALWAFIGISALAVLVFGLTRIRKAPNLNGKAG